MTKNYPHIATPPPGPKAQGIIARDRASTATCYLKEYPLAVARGSGAMIEDVDGNRYLDFMAGIAVASTGHSHPTVVAAVQEAASQFLHICGGDFYYESFAALPERLAKLAPGREPKKVFLSNSGTEAVEGAIKLARHSTRRAAIIAFEGSFHGRSLGALSLTASKYTQRSGMGPFLPEVYHAPYGDADFIESRLFARRLDPKDVAAIFVEPIQGEGGYIVPPAGFLKSLRAICDKHGILLIFDEVITGFGRLGHWFGSERYDIRPDIVTSAKGLSSSYAALGAVIATDKVMEPFMGATSMFSHGITFGGHPVMCAIALKNIEIMKRERILEHVRENEDAFRTTLAQLLDLPIVGDLRGTGFFWAIELVKDKDTRETFSDEECEKLLRGYLSTALWDAGMICRADDRGDPVIQISPPLVAGQAEFDEITGILGEVLTGAVELMR